MSEFNIESATIDVERIMSQIRARISEKRGEDYTEEQIRELASVKLERFLDPKNIRSGMVEFYQKRLEEKKAALQEAPPPPSSFEFDPDIIYRSSRGVSGRILYRIRKLLSPLLKFFFNPAPILHALTVQQQINQAHERQAEVISQMVRAQAEFIEIAALNFEVMNNLVVEMTRLSIEMKNHKMRVESVAGRLDFDERRARALEKVVQYREGTPASGEPSEGSTERRRRRRRRGRRRPTGSAAEPSTTGQSSDASSSETGGATGEETGQPHSTETAHAGVPDPPVVEGSPREPEPPRPSTDEGEPPASRPTPSPDEGDPSDR